MRLSIKRVNERLEQFLRIEQLRVTTSVRATYVSETKLKGEKSLRWISARSTRRAGQGTFQRLEQKRYGSCVSNWWNAKDIGPSETCKALARAERGWRLPERTCGAVGSRKWPPPEQSAAGRCARWRRRTEMRNELKEEFFVGLARIRWIRSTVHFLLSSADD